ncbi:MAG: putative synthase protein [Polaromonas sp.]|jgi:ATP synthase protein I|nr:putative synthase protein [Polaromonas sp.]
MAYTAVERTAGSEADALEKTKVVVKPGSLDVIDEAQDEGFKPLTREEAKKVRALNPPIALWWVVAGQFGVGVAVALLAWALTGQARMGWSAAYGALAVVIPAALFARGLSRQQSAVHGNAALAGFFVWEMVKITLTVAMLLAAPRLVKELNWLALLAGFVVTMKVYWAAMWLRPARKKSVNNF